MQCDFGWRRNRSVFIDSFDKLSGIERKEERENSDLHFWRERLKNRMDFEPKKLKIKNKNLFIVENRKEFLKVLQLEKLAFCRGLSAARTSEWISTDLWFVPSLFQKGFCCQTSILGILFVTTEKEQKLHKILCCSAPKRHAGFQTWSGKNGIVLSFLNTMQLKPITAKARPYTAVKRPQRTIWRSEATIVIAE